MKIVRLTEDEIEGLLDAIDFQFDRDVENRRFWQKLAEKVRKAN